MFLKRATKVLLALILATTFIAQAIVSQDVVQAAEAAISIAPTITHSNTCGLFFAPAMY
jgi:hypothetical protein